MTHPGIRAVRVAMLPEMRLAYIERENSPQVEIELWETFNTWRLKSRPQLGRVDIAAIGWWMTAAGRDQPIALRAAVPVRSDYAAPPPAHTTFFPGGPFVYCYADDGDQLASAFAAVTEFIGAQSLVVASGPIELYKFHYNLDQHPADCGYLLEVPEGEVPRPTGPLHVAR